jgi:hypothetical protein
MHLVLPCVRRVLVELELERPGALVDRVRDPVAEHRELADDTCSCEAGLLVQLAQHCFLRRLAGTDPARGYLCAGVRVVAVLEDEQLGTAVALARHVGKHTLAHYLAALSFAL